MSLDIVHIPTGTLLHFDIFPKQVILDSLEDLYTAATYKELTVGGDLLFELFKGNGIIDPDICLIANSRHDLFKYFRRRSSIEEFEVLK